MTREERRVAEARETYLAARGGPGQVQKDLRALRDAQADLERARRASKGGANGRH